LKKRENNKMTHKNLDAIKQTFDDAFANVKTRIIICAGTGCVANGSLKVHEEFVKQIKDNNLPVTVELKEEKPDQDSLWVSKSGCQGFCQMGPLVTLEPQGIMYTKVKPADVEEIVTTSIMSDQLVERLLYKQPGKEEHCRGIGDIPFYTKQNRHVIKDCGHIDPANINEYVAKNGYKAAYRAIKEMTPEEVCKEVLESGLRGRGGGGFPTGKKWDLTRIEVNEKKYVICNGDEGDPGAFMDRSVLEGNPHSVIEGMIVTARAIGANEGYAYIRAEYPLAVNRMRAAVNHAMERGLLGDNIFDSDFSFHIHVMEGAGAFVCGEETALIASIEGQRGMPRPKPPFPAQSGLWGKPTVINNVETLATVPLIIRDGVEEFRKLGTSTSPGTKTFALTGHVANTGLIEVPFGTTLREIVYEIGGGVTDDDGNIMEDDFKAVQIGGPSGGCLTPEHLDLPLDFDSLKSIGAMVGSGGLVVMNKNTCMVQIAKFFMQFTQNESCGKCIPCREGTKQMLEMLNMITEGEGSEETMNLLKQVGRAVQKASLCGLGKTAPNPVLSTIEAFRSEYLAHVDNQKCPTRQCKKLSTPEIIADLCKGCTLCSRKCPVGAISGEKKQAHVIDAEVCINCGACIEACKFNAIA
jgi:NADH-quinone oxidoreductase subunit F